MHPKRILAAIAASSLSTRIITGLALGIFTGLFLGEPAAVLQPVADIYIRLMQMTVLPYLVMSLIIGFGQLEANEARRLALRGSLLLVLVWMLSFAVIAAMPLAFPVMQSAWGARPWMPLAPTRACVPCERPLAVSNPAPRIWAAIR